MKERRRGEGGIYKPKGTSNYHCRYFLRGVEHRESTRTANEKQAEKFLKRRLREVGADLIGAAPFVGPQQERIEVSQLLDALEGDYKLRGKDSPQFKSHMKHVREHFGRWWAVEVTAEAVDKYVTARLDAKYKPATINRHTQLLSQAFNLAVEREHLSKAPPIRKLSEKGNVRQGFLADAEFHEIRAYLPAYLYDYSGFDYLVGWRKGEVSSLLWEDMDGDEIRLRGVNSKNEAPRLVLGGELAEIIERRRADRWVQAKSGPVMSAYVFHLKGCPVGDFKKAWRSACVKAGLGRFECKKCGKVLDRPRCRECRKETKYYGPLYHDFRRTAARNMIRAGVPEKVAMAVTGHKTRSMFDRYNIVNGADLREAMDLTQAYLKNGGQRPHRTAVMAMEATAK